MKFFTRYVPAPSVQLHFHFPSLTEQHHKDDCDVNTILRRYVRTGDLSTSAKTPIFGDFSALPQDYAAAIRLISDANARFQQLPSAVRERFGNNPEALLFFINDPSNRDEAVKLGLIEKKKEVKETSPVGEVTTEGGEQA